MKGSTEEAAETIASARVIAMMASRRNGASCGSGGQRQGKASVDPMNIYLREMGNLTLLSHDEEIQLARMIEEGEARVQKGILCLTLGITTLNSLAHGLCSGKMRIVTVLKGITDSDEEGLAGIEEEFLAAIETANTLNNRRLELFTELKKNVGDGEEAKRLEEEIIGVASEISELFIGYQLCSKGLFSVAEAVK